MKRILVIHRNCLFRDCLANYLESNGKFEATSQDHDMTGKGENLVPSGTDILLLDTNLPDNRAKQIIEEVRAEHSPVKIVLLVPDDHRWLFECMAVGVQGCVLERSSLQELRTAIESVASGDTYCPGEFAKLLFTEVTRLGPAFTWALPASSAACRLTVREQEVLALIAERKCNKEIAKELSVSLFTVKNHVHSILEKLHVANRMEAVDAARQENLLSRF